MLIYNMKYFLIYIVAIFLTGCVSSDYLPNSRVIVDTKNIDFAKYQEDLFECRQYASGIDKGTETAKRAAGGAVAGAAVGSIIGNSSDAGKGAALGGLIGATSGLLSSQGEIDKIIKTCLSGRGYTLPN